MRPKTQRAYRRTMHAYSLGFGFRPPYQLLVDADFCLEASKQKIDMRKELEITFQEPTKTFITECSIQELRKQGKEAAAANELARSFERRRCPHTHKPIASTECLAQVVGPENKFNYCVGSQNVEFRNQLREIPGIPMFYVKSHMIVMEMMPKNSKAVVKKREEEKMLPSAKETEKLKTAKMIASPEEEEKKKKKKGKGVNPLSNKKSTKIPPPPPKRKRAQEEPTKAKKQKAEAPADEPTPPMPEGGDAKDADDKKKKRRRRKKTKQADSSEAAPSKASGDDEQQQEH